jgi:hypothetical protein
VLAAQKNRENSDSVHLGYFEAGLTLFLAYFSTENPDGKNNSF